ncbi:MAG: Holliday junction branch migration protein RuvA [Paludibacteraceae bacterium]|nr:Holliday junction branch migration protein RuvA [Paludibacteraceae bacterium]
MLEYINGEITSLTPTYAVLDVNGVGFGVNISLSTYTAIQDKTDAKLYLYEVIREDSFTLYGFATADERSMFLLLMSVQGVGAATARMVLSSLSVYEICDAIQTGNVNLIKAVKGIGAKTAQRIILDLKDKVLELSASAGTSSVSPKVSPISTEIQNEAVSALMMLGFAASATQKAVSAILTEEPDLKVEQVIKKALKML